jgi:hypothetical protein
MTKNIDSLKEEWGKKLDKWQLKAFYIRENDKTFLYRARKIADSFNKENRIKKSDLMYPPVEFAKQSRCNRNGISMFYCSSGKEAPFFESPP